jgi:hypothetical protein
VGGVALSSSIMEVVAKQVMGRVQTLFSISAILLQVSLAPLVGFVAHKISLTLAAACVGSLYLLAAVSGMLGARMAPAEKPSSDLVIG